ncbi:hypothetical protein F4782DRAFT_534955 [Xylaria castorea]|nr:hypothetical protein F4782DRAFT_534955 [Xylaria castorea]
MATASPISLETIVNVVFGILACLISIGGVVATIRAGRKQRYQRPDLEPGLILRHQHTVHLIRQETLQSFGGYGHGHGRDSLPPSNMVDGRNNLRL